MKVGLNNKKVLRLKIHKWHKTCIFYSTQSVPVQKVVLLFHVLSCTPNTLPLQGRKILGHTQLLWLPLKRNVISINAGAFTDFSNLWNTGNFFRWHVIGQYLQSQNVGMVGKSAGLWRSHCNPPSYHICTHNMTRLVVASWPQRHLHYVWQLNRKTDSRINLPPTKASTSKADPH